jgi:hypothetical protein
MAVTAETVNLISSMSDAELADFIEDRRSRVDVLTRDAIELEREADLARRTVRDFISEVAYARIKLRRRAEDVL